MAAIGVRAGWRHDLESEAVVLREMVARVLAGTESRSHRVDLNLTSAQALSTATVDIS